MTGRSASAWWWLTPIATGVTLAVLVWVVCAALGYSSWASLVDAIIGGLGLVFAFSLATGLNLGIFAAIKSVDGDATSPVDSAAALRVASFSLTMLAAGFVTSLIVAG